MRVPKKVLQYHEKEKKKMKKKDLAPCLQQHPVFVSFVVSVDGLVGKEAKNLIK